MPKIKDLLVFLTSIILTTNFFVDLINPRLTSGVAQAQAQAQMARGTATDLLEVAGDAKPGSIISHNNGVYSPSQEPYDPEIFGAVVENSSITITNSEREQSVLVLRLGDAQILVSNANGDIKKGDYITSSDVPGVGQKADKTGFVVGIAREDFIQPVNDTQGLVWATIEPKYAYINNTVKTNLLDALKSGSLSPLLNPVESLRYILAALIVATTFIIGFSTFGKTSGRTIEALGRNPLAQGSIRTAMIFNTILAFGVMLVGLALAYLILVL